MGPAPPIPFTEGSDEEDEPPSAPELIQATEQLKLMALESSDRHERRITCELLRSALLDMIGSGDIKGTVDLSRLLADDEDDVSRELLSVLEAQLTIRNSYFVMVRANRSYGSSH